MATTLFVDLVTLTAAAWFNPTDTVVYHWLTSPAGANTITATGPASMTAYAAGQKFSFLPANDNTGATTINITPSGGSALGAKNIFQAGSACIGGEIQANVPCTVQYDGTQFNVVGPFNGGEILAAIRYGGVTLTNAVTGTGKMVLDTSPTFTTSLIAASTTMALLNTVATTINFGGAATAINMGAGASSTLTASFTTAIALNTAAISSNQATVALLATPTTVNFAQGASTALNIGHASGTNTVAGATTFSQALTAASLFDISGASAGQIKFPATQNASADANTFDDYREGSFTGTLTGCTTSPTGIVYYTKIGNKVTLYLPTIAGTSNTTAATVTGAPAILFPSATRYMIAKTEDNSAYGLSTIQIATNGTITLFPTIAEGAFTASGEKGVAQMSVSYIL